MKALYERHSDALYRFLRARLGDPFEAADVMQETFLEIWRAAGRFEGRSAARTWIFGIARNKAVDRMRRGAREVRRRARRPRRPTRRPTPRPSPSRRATPRGCATASGG